jgi:SRSO17 transposase
MAEQAKQARPYGMQRLLSGAVWDGDGVRDDLRSYVVEQLGTADAIGILDESGFPKRGKKSAGVKRQYCGVTGRVENCQVGVFLSYATQHGHAIIDRDLYLPEDWIDDRERRQEAGIAETVQFAPKWELALHMLKRAREAGILFSWVVADSVYGQAGELRKWLEEQGIASGLGIPGDEAVCVQTPDGSYHLAEAREIATTLVKEEDWHRLAISQGTKGPRFFDWELLPLVHRGTVDGRHFLLMRRCIDDANEKAYYLVFAPPAARLAEIVGAVGKRWHIEEDLEASKDLGLDQYEVRSFIGWYRHITLVLLAYALLVSIRVHDQSHLSANADPEQVESSLPLIPITTSEVRHLLARLFFPSPCNATLVQAWSSWRRQHQYGASSCHSRARLKAG